MNTASPSPNRLRWEDHYAQGNTPWDTRITPPEVEAFWAERPIVAGDRALDLGCGAGTNVVFLARRGLQAVGVDLAGTALQLGRQRVAAESSPLATHASFVQADVTRLPIAGLDAVYILDIGCLHGIDPSARQGYALSVIANLAPGGHYHLYAFDRLPEAPDSTATTDASDATDATDERSLRGLEPDECARLFTPALEIVEVVQAEPQRQPCRWYLLRKPASSSR